MAKEEYVYTLDDIARYRPIALAQDFAKNKDTGGLEKSLLTVLENIGVRDADRKDVASTLDPQKFIKLHTEKYQKALGSQKLSDLRGLYSDLFEKFYNEDNLPKVDEVFNSDKTYGDISKEYAKLGEIVESKTDNFTKEQKEEAQKKLIELNKIVAPLNLFEAYKLDELRKPIAEDSMRQRLNDAYKEEEAEAA